MPPPDRVQTVAPSFVVTTPSRFPQLADYDSVNHRHRPEYVHPKSYRIHVSDRPALTRGDHHDDREPAQHRPGHPDEHPQRPHVYRVNGEHTTGWRFSLSGNLSGEQQLGPQRPTVVRNGRRTLPSMSGQFLVRPEQDAWEFTFDVPGPGSYTVTAERMNGTRVVSTHSNVFQLRDLLVVSIGDSIASGQGNPDTDGKPEGFHHTFSPEDLIPGVLVARLAKELAEYGAEQLVEHLPQIARAAEAEIDMAPPPVWQEPLAYRSLRSGAALAAKRCENIRAGTTVTFLGFGRTDAEIRNGLIDPRKKDGRSRDGWVGDRGQLQEVRDTVGDRRIDALIIQIGMNDIGVSTNLRQLVVGDLTAPGSDSAEHRTANRKAVEEQARGRISGLLASFRLLAEEVAVLKPRQVYLVEYPSGLFDDATGEIKRGCEVFSGPSLDLSRQDAVVVQEVVDGVNAELQKAAHDHGWIYVSGVSAAFRRHGYCTAPAIRYFVTCTDSLTRQGDTEGSVHPNGRGHEVIAAAVAARLQRFTVAPRPEFAPPSIHT